MNNERIQVLGQKIEDVKKGISKLETLETLGDINEGQLERLQNLRAGLGRLQVEHSEARRAALSAMLDAGTTTTEAGADFGGHSVNGDSDDPWNRAIRLHRDEALRAVDRNRGILSAAAGDRLDGIIRSDPEGADSRYLTAIADPIYERAFARLLSGRGAENFFPEPERAAILRVQNAMWEQRTPLAQDTAGYAVPFALDPTVSMVSSGVINPLRQIARVITISGSTWKGVDSAGVVSSYDLEASEVSDDTPVLTQPEAKVLTARAFVPFSVESEDWVGLRAELVREFQESKDSLEATQFLLGTGVPDSPEGLLVGATSLATTAGSATIAIGDIYDTKASLAPRYQPTARWLGSSTILDKVRRLVGPGNTTEPAIWSDNGPSILRKPVSELSTMTTATTSGQKVLVYGSFERFVILERLGVVVELVPHLLGQNLRPTLQRGLLAYWRNTSFVRTPSAFTVLTTL